MSGHRKFSELRAGLSPEAQAEARALATRLREEMALHEVRAALDLTQKSLGDILGVGQSAVAKLEKRTDMYVSNLRHFINAMGGELEIVARFPEGEVRISNFAEVRDREKRLPS